MDLRTLVNEARARLSAETGKRISMSAIAKRCQVGRSHLYRVLDGEATPGFVTIKLLAKGLGVTADQVRAAMAATAKSAEPRPGRQ